jgi:hypothetical protein
MQKAFSTLSSDDFYTGRDIAVYYDQELVGGATLKNVISIEDDPDLDRNWVVVKPISATRILRLWTVANARRRVLYYILDIICEVTNKDTFCYGILSLPLGVSIERKHLFSSHLGWLSPKLELKECKWDPDGTPTSEGRKLLAVYLFLGADPLGPASGNEKDQSVRIVMGTYIRKVKIEKIKSIMGTYE